MDAYDSAMIRACLPETWTHVHNVNLLQIGYAAKLAGLDWKSLPELFAALERNGHIQRDGYTFRRASTAEKRRDDSPQPSKEKP